MWLLKNWEGGEGGSAFRTAFCYNPCDHNCDLSAYCPRKYQFWTVECIRYCNVSFNFKQDKKFNNLYKVSSVHMMWHREI